MFVEIAELYKDHLTRFAPYPPAHDRMAWNKLPEDILSSLIRAGEAYLNDNFPVLHAVDYMEFTRTGNRSNYEEKLFKKRTMLNHLVLAECAEYHGRFLDQIINGLFSICEEAAWQLPAHNSYVRDTPQHILPNVAEPVIDLFAAETGAVVAITEYLLERELHGISRHIHILIEENLEKRIFTPYLNRHFWWMGDGESHMNNWTVWCTQNVLLAAFSRNMDAMRKSEILKKAAGSLDCFLREYGEDGCCDEGAQYYRHAGLCLFQSMEILSQVTNGAVDSLFRNRKICNIAAYILNAHIDGIYYVNFADCSAVAGRCNAREFLFGKRTGNQELMAFAADDYLHSETPLLPDEHNLYYRLQSVFTASELRSYPYKSISHKELYYESTGLFIARDERFYLAVKAGDNDDSHNHNDTGSFTVYKDGKPLFIDVGVESYTKKTFSQERYDIWTMQSQYHNLPAFNGIMQKDGPEYRADRIHYDFCPEESCISMDLANAYPDDRIRSYTRNVILQKGSKITVTDTYQGEVYPVVLSLMTYEKPVVQGNIIQIGTLGSCRVTGGASIKVEEILVTDQRLKIAWKDKVYRCLISFAENSLNLIIT